jgi:solute carrier family 8 (sodium/calcium exchanger)
MALGSSAPEILLSVIETLQSLGVKPGELGPSTIVGSAAFNLMVISAVSVMAVETGSFKKVVAITSLWSVFAYVWLLIVLSVWTPDEVTMEEAILTLSFFICLITTAFAADKCKRYKMAKAQGTNPGAPKDIG